MKTSDQPVNIGLGQVRESGDKLFNSPCRHIGVSLKIGPRPVSGVNRTAQAAEEGVFLEKRVEALHFRNRRLAIGAFFRLSLLKGNSLLRRQFDIKTVLVRIGQSLPFHLSFLFGCQFHDLPSTRLNGRDWNAIEIIFDLKHAANPTAVKRSSNHLETAFVAAPSQVGCMQVDMFEFVARHEIVRQMLLNLWRPVKQELRHW